MLATMISTQKSGLEAHITRTRPSGWAEVMKGEEEPSSTRPVACTLKKRVTVILCHPRHARKSSAQEKKKAFFNELWTEEVDHCFVEESCLREAKLK
jgi:hypothetical protein